MKLTYSNSFSYKMVHCFAIAVRSWKFPVFHLLDSTWAKWQRYKHIPNIANIKLFIRSTPPSAGSKEKKNYPIMFVQFCSKNSSMSPDCNFLKRRWPNGLNGGFSQLFHGFSPNCIYNVDFDRSSKLSTKRTDKLHDFWNGIKKSVFVERQFNENYLFILQTMKTFWLELTRNKTKQNKRTVVYFMKSMRMPERDTEP